MHRAITRILACLLVAGATSGALAAPAGSAQGVDPQAEARGDETRTLVVGSDVFIGDRILTGPRGQVQILFADKTKLVVGPRSALVIEDYLLRDDGSAGKLVLDALGGTYRFVTGGAPKDRYLINVPGGTITVRGTGLEITVDQATGIAYVLVQSGKATGCGGGECTDADNVCEVMTISANGTELLGEANGLDQDILDQLEEYFKYANDQSPLIQSFRIANGLDCLNRPVNAGGGGGSLSEGGDGGDDYYYCPECSY